MEGVKWTDKIKNAVLLERVGEGKINAGTGKEEEKKLAGPLARKEHKPLTYVVKRSLRFLYSVAATFRLKKLT